MKTNNSIYVAFHIGRGGRFNNSGHKTFIGKMTFSELITLRSQYLFERNRDEKGRFCKPYLTQDNGNFVSDDDQNGNVGKLNFDYDYDSDIVKEINDCTEEEIKIIANSNKFKNYELILFLENYSQENNLGWNFDRFGMLTQDINHN